VTLEEPRVLKDICIRITLLCRYFPVLVLLAVRSFQCLLASAVFFTIGESGRIERYRVRIILLKDVKDCFTGRNLVWPAINQHTCVYYSNTYIILHALLGIIFRIIATVKTVVNIKLANEYSFLVIHWFSTIIFWYQWCIIYLKTKIRKRKIIHCMKTVGTWLFSYRLDSKKKKNMRSPLRYIYTVVEKSDHFCGIKRYFQDLTVTRCQSFTLYGKLQMRRWARIVIDGANITVPYRIFQNIMTTYD
jgi:hypothetical protein